MAVHLPSKSGEIDWYKVARNLIEVSNGNIRPWEIGKFTIPEIIFMLDQPGEHRPHSGRGHSMSAEEMHRSMQEWKALTPRQKLEQKRAES